MGRVKLTPPSRKLEFKELDITAIVAQEIDCPWAIEPLEWMLLTTMAVENFDEAVEKLSRYAKRWGIEVYHRTLKSGCKIEERQLGSADRLEACLAIDMIVAWRIFHLDQSSDARLQMCRARFSLKKPSGKPCIVLSDKIQNLRINRPR